MAARIEWQVQRNVMMEILRVEMEESLLARLALGVSLTSLRVLKCKLMRKFSQKVIGGLFDDFKYVPKKKK